MDCVCYAIRHCTHGFLRFSCGSRFKKAIPVLRRTSCPCVCLAFFLCVLVGWSAACADPLRAIHQQGAVHAFLVVRDESGKVIGTGDELNMRAGNVWKGRLMLHFYDGSLDDETTVYTQHATLRLVSDHHVQKGPSFPQPMDMTIDMAKKSVTWHEVKDGKDEVKTEAMDLPADLCNGLMPQIMQNIPKGTQELKVGYIAALPKPRIVKLGLHPDGQDPFSLGGAKREAVKYRVHVDLGGIIGLVAPIVGKEPPDLYIWVAAGEVPTFLRLNGFLYLGGPIWSLDLSSPTWPSRPAR